MPRSGINGTYTPPPNTDNQQPLTSISSAMFNGFVQDVTQTFNTPTPVAYGGTGGATAIAAIDNLVTKGTDLPTSGTLNLDAVTGQFVDLTGNTTVTAVTLSEGRHRMTRAAGDFQITVGASLIGNGGVNAAIKAGDLIFWEGYSGGVVRFWIVRAVNSGATLVDTRRNRVVNNDMRVSQENGTTSGTANAFSPVDQFAQFRNTSAGVLTVQQVTSVTPAGSPNRIRATVTTPDASLAAGEYWIPFSQNLEGSNVADFKYGAAGAFNSVLRFGFRAPAGTYAVAIHNSAANRSFVSMFTIAVGQANTDTVQTVSIPGDVTGTWLTADGVIGLTMDIVVAAGTTYQGTAGWQSGYILATNAISNGMGTGGAVFELFDVGLRLDPDATGVYGQYEVGEISTVWRSERYWEKFVGLQATGYSTAGNVIVVPLLFFQKAKIPSITFANTTLANATGLAANGIGLKNLNYRFDVVSTGSSSAISDCLINARLS